jgi:hypothetical protein
MDSWIEASRSARVDITDDGSALRLRNIVELVDKMEKDLQQVAMVFDHQKEDPATQNAVSTVVPVFDAEAELPGTVTQNGDRELREGVTSDDDIEMDGTDLTQGDGINDATEKKSQRETVKLTVNSGTVCGRNHISHSNYV